MEKFCLKWNDFQTNVTNSFKRLKDEKDFFDVTLVWSDYMDGGTNKVKTSRQGLGGDGH